jgi:hypothetical protein
MLKALSAFNCLNSRGSSAESSEVGTPERTMKYLVELQGGKKTKRVEVDSSSYEEALDTTLKKYPTFRVTRITKKDDLKTN